MIHRTICLSTQLQAICHKMRNFLTFRIENYEDGISWEEWYEKSDQEYSNYIDWDYRGDRLAWVDDAPEMHRQPFELIGRHSKMNINEVYTSNWLKAADLQGRKVKVRIEDWDVTEFKQNDGTTRKQVTLKFLGKEKRLGLNRINSSMIAGMYGEDTEGWIGKEVTLYPTKDRGPNGLVDCIRVEFVDPRIALNGEAREVPKPKLKQMPVTDERNPPDELNDEVPF